MTIAECHTYGSFVGLMDSGCGNTVASSFCHIQEFFLVNFIQSQQELFAALSESEITRMSIIHDQSGDLLQNPVTGIMTMFIIDQLEMIDAQHQH